MQVASLGGREAHGQMKGGITLTSSRLLDNLLTLKWCGMLNQLLYTHSAHLVRNSFQMFFRFF
jgi:hypothetical protein